MGSVKFLCSVAGVKFEGRQDILSRICKNKKSGEVKFLVSFQPTTYTDPATQVIEDAVAVFAGKEQIGFIPRKELSNPAVMSEETAVATCGWYAPAKAYTVNLYKHNIPSPKQYAYVKSVCNKNGWALPLYTAEAFSAFITSYQKAGGK